MKVKNEIKKSANSKVVELVTFDERVMNNSEIIHKNNSAAMADNVVDSYKYLDQMDPTNADSNMLDAVNSARLGIYKSREISSITYLNLVLTKLLSFDEECANKILPLFMRIIEKNIEDKDLKDILANILIHQLKEQSDTVLGIAENNDGIKRFILGLVEKHDLYTSIIQRGPVSNYTKAAFDQFIMIYFSESIKQWIKLWMDSILKASVGFVQFGKDIFDADLLADQGRLAIEYVYGVPEVVDQLFAIFNHMINMVCAFREMDCTKELFILDKLSDKVMDKVMDNRRNKNDISSKIDEKSTNNDNDPFEELVLGLLEDPTIEHF